MAVKGGPRTFYKQFKFIVEIDQFGSSEFSKCSKLEREIAVVEQWQGGKTIPDKSPGRAKFTDLVLERGSSDDLDIHDWFEQVIDVSANSGLVDAKYKRTLDIIAQDRDGTTLRRWRVYNAFPIKHSPGEFDNDSDKNVTEMVTLAYDYYKVVP